MLRILQINASLNSEQGQSSRLANAFVESLREQGRTLVMKRDLALDPGKVHHLEVALRAAARPRRARSIRTHGDAIAAGRAAAHGEFRLELAHLAGQLLCLALQLLNRVHGRVGRRVQGVEDDRWLRFRPNQEIESRQGPADQSRTDCSGHRRRGRVRARAWGS